jgi:N-acetylneuraminic acid mutarotase
VSTTTRISLLALSLSLLVPLLAAGCDPQGFFPDDIPRDPPADAPCSPDAPRGLCDDGETCREGECLADASFCSAENPGGLCPSEEERCVGGACINTENACSEARPDGECPSGLSCQGGVCASENPCSPAERFGFCVAGDVCLDGACVDRDSVCDDDTPGGLCPSGLSCSEGICVPQEQVCGCTPEQQCLDGVCRDPQLLCSPDVPDGLCSGGAVCAAGTCTDVGAGCSAQNPTGVCSPGSICRAGTCAAVDGAALCDDDNECTADSFDPARNRCDNRAVSDGADCDDGNACTNDGCVAGACVGTSIAQCVEPPVIDPVVSPTNIGQLAIAGDKPAGASIVINDQTAVPESPDTRFSVTVNLVPGENIYRIKSVDQGASSGVRELKVVYDITPPQTRISPEGGRFVAGITATIATDEPATVFFTTDGSTPDETDAQFTSLKELRIFGPTTIKVRAKDLAGNLEEDVVTVEFDVTARGSSWRLAGQMEEGLARAGAAFVEGRVIVAGGTDGLAAQAGVFAFDIDSDTLSTLPSMSGARAGLTMITVSDAVFAIGGENAGTPLNRVERLQTDATAWETLAPMPSTRHAMGAAVFGGEIFVFGGAANGNAVVDNVEVYSIADNTWRNDVAPLPRARAGFGTAVIDDEIYLVGGEGAGGALVNEVDVYSFETDTWRQVASLPTPRSFLSVGAVVNIGRASSGDRAIVAAGGRDSGGNTTATVEEYVVEDDRWSTRALLPAGRHSGASVAVTVADDVDDVRSEVWTIGGLRDTLVSREILGFSAPRDHVRRMPDLPEARFLHGAAHLDDRVYLFGGRDFSEETAAWAFDPETGTYEVLPALPSVQNAPAAVAVGDRVYAIGGFDQFGNAIATTRAYDPIERRWIERQPMTSGRGNAAAAVVGTDIHVVGGENGAALPTVEIYSTVTNTWRAGPLLPAPRTGAMAVNHQGNIVVVGGVADGDVTTIVRRTPDGWETLTGSMPVSFGYATVLSEDHITVFPGRTSGVIGGAPFVYDVVNETVLEQAPADVYLGAPLDRRPGATVLGRVFLFGGNANDAIGPGGTGIVEEIRGHCFNGVQDGREAEGLGFGDHDDGCASQGFAHQSGTGVSFTNDRSSNTSSLQGAIDACNAHFGGNVCADACGGGCTQVTRNGACSCNEPFIWHYGTQSCFSSNPAPGLVTGSSCSSTIVGQWN